MAQYAFHFNASGSVLYKEVHKTPPYPSIPADPLVWVTTDSEVGEIDQNSLLAVFESGQVMGVTIDPDYTPPASTPDPVQARLEALESAVAANLLVSPHDRRWLAQKERAKLFGIPWLREHPEAEQQDLEVAVLADLAEAFPAQPLVVSGGVIMSYAAEAAARGYIPDASFASLKGLILASSEQQLQAMLAAL